MTTPGITTSLLVVNGQSQTLALPSPTCSLPEKKEMTLEYCTLQYNNYVESGVHECVEERLTLHIIIYTLVEHYFSEFDQPMSKSGMHFYGMGGHAKYSQLSVYNGLPIP